MEAVEGVETKMGEDSAEKITAYVAVELMARVWARRPFRRHRLDLCFEGGRPPYLMTGHIFDSATGQPVNSRWFRVGVMNRSSSRIDDVCVQLVSVDPPDLVPVVPVPLHLMHDNPPPGQPNLQTFSVEPGGDTPTQFVDVVSKVVGQPTIQIEHTVAAVAKLFPARSSIFALKISAPYERSRIRRFSVGLDVQGELTFHEI